MESTQLHQWHWVRIHTRERCKDRILLDIVEPCVTRLHSGSPGSISYFERSCVDGPNILVGVRLVCPGARTQLTSCVEEIREQLNRFAVIQPPATDREMQMVAALANYEARSEGTNLNYTENYVRDNCEDPPAGMLSAGALLERTREFKASASKVVFRWLKLIEEGKHTRAEIALLCLISAAWLGSRTRLRAHLSFRSHVDGFLRDADPNGSIRACFSRNYRSQHSGSMRTLVMQSVADLNRGAHQLAGFSEYVDLVRELMRDLSDGLTTGRYHAPGIAELEARLSTHFEASDPSNTNKVPSSTRFADPALLLSSHPVIRTWQITVNLVYSVLNQLGISPMERFFACYCLSQAVQEVYGESPDSIRHLLFASNRPYDVFKFVPLPSEQ